MEKVGELSHLTINLLKKFVACAIRDSFYRKFQFSCPPVLYKVKTLALLPHTLDIQCSWKDIPVDLLCSSMSILRSELPSVLKILTFSSKVLNLRALATGSWTIDYITMGICLPGLNACFPGILTVGKILNPAITNCEKFANYSVQVRFVFKKRSGMALILIWLSRISLVSVSVALMPQ